MIKYIVVLCVGAALGVVGSTLVSQSTYQQARQETRTHIDSAVGSAATAAHNALSQK